MATSPPDLDDLEFSNPRQKAKGPGYLHLGLLSDEMAYNLTQDFLQGKPLDWPVVASAKVHKIWSEFVEHGAVKDELGLHQVFESVRDSFLRLEVANIVSGHTGLDPATFFEDMLDPHELEPFCDWLIEGDGHWRISDYGADPLRDAIALAFEAPSNEKKLKYLDRALHVTHMRGDLSRLFIEGGRDAVLDLDQMRPDPQATDSAQAIVDKVAQARLACGLAMNARPAKPSASLAR